MDRARHEGRAYRTRILLVRVCTSPLPYLRVGIVVPKFGHTAVERNQLKRWVREIVRLRVLSTSLVGDLCVWMQPGAYRATYDDVQRELGEVLSRLTSEPAP